ncbi:MAG: hypothetical protein AB1405_03715 [Bdellovibrionota bacterium]
MPVIERPILFSDQMVRAILDGRKTRTRRVLVPQPNHPITEISKWRGISHGDRLYVREAWHTDERDLATARAKHEDFMSPSPIFYRATEEVENPDAGWIWRPSIHMPRWASRILLEVEEIWPERLQDITEEEAGAEGVEPRFEMSGADFIAGKPVDPTYRIGFKHLWDEINGKRAGEIYSWKANPWVAVITFEMVKPERKAA